jgi:ferredoxin
VKIRLHRQACQGHGRCYALSPGLFDCDEEGYAVLRDAEDDGVGDGGGGDGGLVFARHLDPSQQADAARAADNCPEFAITLE